jgi:putative ABC transport system permease protein
MNWFESLKLAADSLWANRLRSFLTMIGLIIGIGSVILVIAFGVGAQQFVQKQLQEFGTNVVNIFTGGPRTQGTQPLTMEDAEAIRTQSTTVENVAPLAIGNGQAVKGIRNVQAQINGTSASLASVLKVNYVKGRYFTPTEIEGRSRVVILGEGLSKKLFDYEDPIGKTITISSSTSSQQMVVVGITRRGFFESVLDLDKGLMVPLPLAMDSFVESYSPFGKKITALFVKGKTGVSLDEVNFEIKNLMRSRHHVTDKEDFTLLNLQQIIDLLNNVALAVTIVLGLTAAISLVVSGVGITNIMLASVLERTREIGLRKALGASEEVILTQFVIEAVLLSLIGGMLGVLLGIGAAAIARQFSPVQPEVTLWSILLAAGVSISIGILFGVAPARRAARLDPIVALRSD